MGARIAVLVMAFGFVPFILLALPGREGPKRASTLGTKPGGKMLDTATFAAGCFWHVEDEFRGVEGVVATTVGYEGGTRPHPTYEDVCTNRTGHAEVVQIQFDPAKVSYEHLLEVFFDVHDPTTLDRQGPDVGRQYRSVIFYHTPEQKSAAETLKTELDQSGRYSRPVVTEIAPATTFWKAEEYHQHYFEKERS
jgi:peptide-methionine (S)-S-oxide reductase